MINWQNGTAKAMGVRCTYESYATSWVNSKVTLLLQPSWPFPVCTWHPFLDPLKRAMCFFLKVLRGGADNPGAPNTLSYHSPFEWDVQICFSLEQPLVHMACSWRRCACLSDNSFGPGLAPAYGLSHQDKIGGRWDCGSPSTAPPMATIVYARKQGWI